MNPFQDVFISYGRPDSKQFAQGLKDRLAALGYTVWFDFEDIPVGVDYQKQVDDGIEKADNFVFIISPHSVNSSYCEVELQLALKYNKRIIPLMHVEQITRATWQQRHPDGTDEQWAEHKAAGKHASFPNMHPKIRKINWVYMRESIDNFELNFQKLLELLERHKNYVHQHTVLLAGALEWERNQKQTRYLLIGEERQQAEAWLATRFSEGQPPCIPTNLHCEFITESIKNANNLMTEVFLCHSEQERSIAEQIRQSLMRDGITTWTHHSDIEFGSDFQSAMIRGMEEADNVILLMSPHALTSPYCQRELDHALALHKRIIPLQIAEVKPESIPESLQNLQYIDLTDNQTEADYQQDISDLLRILKQDAAYYHEHKVLLTKALKWERQQHNPSVLLRGYELQHATAWLKLAKQFSNHGPVPLQQEFITESERQPPGLSLDVFISYSRADSDFARRLNDGLQRQGKRTWFDQESIASGADFQQEIYRGIEASDQFLFILSPRSVKSPYCANEVEYAAKLNKRIVTVRHRAVEASDLHPELAKVQWVDFLANDGDFASNFKELLRSLDANPEHLRFHTRLLMQAIDWDEKNRRESLLLRGTELTEAEQWLLQAAGKQPLPTTLQGEYVSVSRRSVLGHQQRLIGMLGSLLVIAIVGASFGFFQSAIARRAQADAEKNLALAEQRQKDMKMALGEAEAARDQARTAQDKEEEQRNLAEQKTQEAKKALAQAKIAQAAEAEQRDFAEQKREEAEHQRQLAIEAQKRAEESAIIASLGEQAAGTRLLSYDNPVNALVMAIQLVGLSESNSSGVLSTVKSALLDLLKIPTEINLLRGHTKPVTTVVFSPDGNYIASGSEDNTVRIWNLDGTLISQPLRGHTDYVNAIAFSPNGQYIVTASSDKTIKIWDWANSSTPLRSFVAHEDKITSVAFSPDGQQIASGGYDGLKLWNFQGELVHTFSHERVNSLAFLPDNKTIVSTNNTSLQFWNKDNLLNAVPDTLISDSGEPFTELHAWAVNTISVSPDGEHIATTGNDNLVRLIDVKTRKVRETFRESVDAVRGVAFSADSQSIAIALETSINIRNLKGDLQGSLRGHQGNMTSVAGHPFDSSLFITGSLDKTLRLWNSHQLQDINSLARDEAYEVQNLLKLACDRLKYHPSLLLETTDRSVDAFRTCRTHVWHGAGEADVLHLQGQRLAQNGDIQDAVSKFEEANSLNPDLRIEPQAEAQRLAAFTQTEASTVHLELPEIVNQASYGQVQLSGFILNGQSNTITASPGQEINGFTNYVYDCPECGEGSINQIILGIAGEPRAQSCIYNGFIQGSGSANFMLTAPREPGLYYVRFRYAQAYGCEDFPDSPPGDSALNWWRVDGEPTSNANIGAILVRE